MQICFVNIRQLVRVSDSGERFKRGEAMRQVAPLENAFLCVKNGRIESLGKMNDFVAPEEPFERVDCAGRVVLPGYVDSHTHLVYARSRADEFVLRLKGASYEEIAANGGGILNSAKRTQAASEEELLQSALLRANEVIRLGTTAIEIKSGYGLTVADELKLLRVAKKLKELLPITVKTTLLGAHALPAEYKQNRKGFLDLVCNEMIPQAAAEGLADYADVFCETGFFTVEETKRVLLAGLAAGLKPRVHANELDYSGGVQAGVRLGALSVDHLECVGDDEITALLGSQTVPTLLPATAYFLRIHYAPARRMIDAGLGVSLASDYNPGTCPSGNLNLVQSIACTQMRLLPEEALAGVTLNAAFALELADELGSLEVGKRANLLITRPMDSFYEIPYYFGVNPIERVYLDGRLYDGLA